MIVFWRLLLAYYISAVLFYHRPFFAWRDRRPCLSALLQGSTFLALCLSLCWPYLDLSWPFLHFFHLPGSICLLFLAIFYVFNDRMLVFRAGQMKYHSLTFLAHDFLIILFIFLCVPFKVLYETGNFMAAPWTLLAVGFLVITKMFSVFIYMVEQDLYGRDYPTIDESFITMLMRLIFYLIILLPGWRWLIWFFAWLWACQIARKNRLMDFSRFALYFSAFGAGAIGFLAKWSFYLR
ncbi:MAG: hypothetical protein IKC13_04875 [Elusimicrobiaceae bacterium]|nr:hypothetical protein [Elusimicrobiaceae bacterium]